MSVNKGPTEHLFSPRSNQQGQQSMFQSLAIPLDSPATRPVPSPSSASSTSSVENDDAFDKALALSASLLANSNDILSTTAQLQADVAKFLDSTSPPRRSINQTPLDAEEGEGQEWTSLMAVLEKVEAKNLEVEPARKVLEEVTNKQKRKRAKRVEVGEKEHADVPEDPPSPKVRPTRTRRKPTFYRPGFYETTKENSTKPNSSQEVSSDEGKRRKVQSSNVDSSGKKEPEQVTNDAVLRQGTESVDEDEVSDSDRLCDDCRRREEGGAQVVIPPKFKSAIRQSRTASSDPSNPNQPKRVEFNALATLRTFTEYSSDSDSETDNAASKPDPPASIPKPPASPMAPSIRFSTTNPKEGISPAVIAIARLHLFDLRRNFFAVQDDSVKTYLPELVPSGGQGLQIFIESAKSQPGSLILHRISFAEQHFSIMLDTSPDCPPGVKGKLSTWALKLSNEADFVVFKSRIYGRFKTSGISLWNQREVGNPGCKSHLFGEAQEGDEIYSCTMAERI